MATDEIPTLPIPDIDEFLRIVETSCGNFMLSRGSCMCEEERCMMVDCLYTSQQAGKIDATNNDILIIFLYWYSNIRAKFALVSDSL